jgi:hypothetical protein
MILLRPKRCGGQAREAWKREAIAPQPYPMANAEKM